MQNEFMEYSLICEWVAILLASPSDFNFRQTNVQNCEVFDAPHFHLSNAFTY